MKQKYIKCNVITRCPDCGGAVSTFEHAHKGQEFGAVLIGETHLFNGKRYNFVLYKLMRCAGCGRGGLAKIHYSDRVETGVLESFYPVSIEYVDIPKGVPKEIISEFREAELCASYGANRAASALFRSTLEKILKANGYQKGTLEAKIDKAADDGIITEARRNKVHEDIRVLGNDVLHDDWREISEDEIEDSHHYAQRILEDFYDDRKTVEDILIQKGRLKAQP